MLLKYAAITNKGIIRENNEDNFYLNGITPKKNIYREQEISVEGKIKKSKRGSFFCVCDGMGGMNAGEKASAYIVKAIKKNKKHINSLMVEKKEDFFNNLLSELNESLYKITRQNVELRGMGTTFVGMLINGDKVVSINVGDSRCYLFRDYQLLQLSTDHSEAQRLIKMGIMDKESAKGTKERNMLYRYIGTPPEVGKLEASYSEIISVQNRDKFIMCSDGLTDMVDDEKIMQILIENQSSKDYARMLVDEALKNGGKDNVSVIVFDILLY